MATYDDFDGVWFTLSSALVHHPEMREKLSFVVVDNHPTGKHSAALKELEKVLPRYRYIPFREYVGTSVRDIVFREAQANVVCCVDSHVLIHPGGLAAIAEYFDDDSHSRDLVQGPITASDPTSLLGTHQEPVWAGGLFGRWKVDRQWASQRSPYELPLQGLGLFACRKDAWPGLHPLMRGFGGEEGYLHERFRRRGGRTVGLPQLVWTHRFPRPQGVPFPMVAAERIRNFELAWSDLGWDPAPMRKYMKSIGASEEDMGLAARAVTHPLASIDAIMVANVNSPQRWANVRRRCQEHEFDWRLERIAVEAGMHENCTCVLREAAHRAQRRGLRSLLLLADDADFADDFLHELSRIQRQLPSNWEIYSAGGSEAERTRAIAMNGSSIQTLASDASRARAHLPLSEWLAEQSVAATLPTGTVTVSLNAQDPIT